MSRARQPLHARQSTGALLCVRVRPPHLQRRIELTVACRDADPIPKVDGTGEVFERDGTRLQRMHNGVVIEEGCYYGAWMTEVIRPARPSTSRRRRRRSSPRRAAARGSAAGTRPGRARQLLGVLLAVVRARAGRRAARARRRRRAHGREGLERINLLLCDAQGAELAMLLGAEEALAARRIRFLVVSTHHHSIADATIHQRCLDALLGHGAHIVTEHTIGESFSGDGLIVASLDPRDRDLTVDLSRARARARDSLFGELEHELAAAFAQRAAHLAHRTPAPGRPRRIVSDDARGAGRRCRSASRRTTGAASPSPRR